MNFSKIILGLLILAACNQKPTIHDKVETEFAVNPQLIKSISDTLFIQENGQKKSNDPEANYWCFYDDKDGYCKLRNDTLMISNSKGNLTSNSIAIFITNGTFSFDISQHGCVGGHTYKAVEQRLTLNKASFNVNDTIVGEMFFKGIYVWDSIKHIIDTIVVAGKFKFRVRDADYSFRKLIQERRYQRFVELSRDRPDTISALNLERLGLKELPEEILLFKNLTELNLDNNDLSTADLSILANLTKLKIINLYGCHLNAFPSVVFNFKRLKELNLYDNNIKELPLELFQMISLKELTIGSNPCNSLPAEIEGLRNLEVLSVRETPLRVFPKSILRLTKLKAIYPPEEMDYFPPQLAKCLTSSFSYSGIKNIDEFEDKIPSD